MSVIKSGYTRALAAYAGPVIPYPNLIVGGVADTTATNELNDSLATFLNDNIEEGDVVYNDATKTSALVVSVSNDQTIILSSDLFTSAGEAYRIFKMSSLSSNGNPGCTLYAPAAGTVSFRTIGGDDITIAVVAGAIIPLQVRSIQSTSVTGLIALW